MIRGVFVAVMVAVVVLLVLAMVMLAATGPAAMAQPVRQPAGPPSGDAKAQPPAQQQVAATQPAQRPGAAPSEAELKAMARAAEEWVKCNPKGKAEPAPEAVMKETSSFAWVKREEREVMGLPAPVWVAEYGKVQPAVRQALQEQRRIMETDLMAAHQDGRPVGFQGTAYVDVYLRHDLKGSHDSKENQAAVKDAQNAVLSRLTAREFSTFFAFKNTAGVIGYVDETGLERLVQDPGVVAVGLDEQMVPFPAARAVSEPRPPVRGEGGKLVPPPPRERIGKIDAEVYKALEKSDDGYVYVLVDFTRIDWRSVGTKRGDAIGKEMENRVLSSLSAQEFRSAGRGMSNATDGYANAAGLAKLENCPDVVRVALGECWGPLD